MTTLAANSPRAYELGDINELPVIQSDIIYEGAFVGDNGSGYARPLAANDPFRGIATRKADNSAGANAAINVMVKTRGLVELTIGTSLAVTDVGKPVYASDDDTPTLTESTNSYIGRLTRLVTTAGKGVVEFDASKGAHGLLATVSDLTNSNGTSVGASTDGTVADVGTAFNQTTLNSNFKEITTQLATISSKINSLLREIA